MAQAVNVYAKRSLTLMADEELVARAKQGSWRATEYILQKYRHVVEGKARSYFLVGADHEDVIQEGMIGLFKAIRDFSEENLSAFRSFAELCITRQIITAVKTATRQKHTVLNSYVSMEMPVAECEDERQLADVFVEKYSTDPEHTLLEKEFRNEVERHICRHLSPLEATALQRYIDGKSYNDIARELNRDVKQIDNALQRAKKKMGRSLQHRMRD